MSHADLSSLSTLVRDVIRDEVETLRLPTYLSTKKAGAIAGVRAATIRSWIRDGSLPAYWAGQDLRVRLCDLEAYLDRKREAAAL